MSYGGIHGLRLRLARCAGAEAAICAPGSAPGAPESVSAWSGVGLPTGAACAPPALRAGPALRRGAKQLRCGERGG